MAHLVRELNVELVIWKAKLKRRKGSGKDINREEEHISRLESRIQSTKDEHDAMAAAVVVETVEVLIPTWSDIDWYDGDTCLYNGVSYTCKRTLLKTWTVVTGDTEYSVQTYWGITNSQLRSWNQALFDQYKTGNQYNLPPVGSVLDTVDPINVKRYPDFSKSLFWELTQ